MSFEMGKVIRVKYDRFDLPLAIFHHIFSLALGVVFQVAIGFEELNEWLNLE